MTRAPFAWRAQSLALAAIFVFAACQSTPPTASPAATTIATPASTAAAPSPSATAAAVDVVPLFADAMQDVSSGVMSMEGSATIGSVKVNISATSRFDGPDSSGTTTTTVGGVSTVVETVKVAGSAYSKVGEGPWLAAAAQGSGPDLATALKAGAKSLSDTGTETRGGKVVHVLTASSGSALDPAVFLSSASGVSDVAGSTTFYCDDDGTPIGATIDITWKQAAGAQTLDGSMTFELEFSSLGSPQTIRAPETVWKRFNATKRGYSIGYPPDYDHTARQGFDYFFGVDESFFFASRTGTEGLTLNLIAKSEISSTKDAINTKTVSNDEIVVGGLPGRLLSAKGSSADLGGKVVLYEAIVVKGKFAYFIAWVSRQGNEAEDLAMFRQVVSTFQFLA